MKKLIIIAFIIIGLTTLYNYKLLEVPSGLTVDEASFGYNAALLSQTGKDERGLPHPVFVLSVIGKDWRQPITQYYLAALFKIFGASVYLLRFSSVIIAVVCVFGVYFLSAPILGISGGIIAATVTALAPIVTIQAHLGLDNIMPMPFVILWLMSLFHYRKSRNFRWLIICALALGFSFYSYKGMRAVTPIWILLTLGWLFFDWRRKQAVISDLITFILVLSPFFLIIPHLEKNYAGAILGNSSPGISNTYDFFLPYLSSFDPSYLFIRGDITPYHSTGRHGMLLLASLPLIVTGIYVCAQSKNSFLRFVLLSLVTAPILYGTVGSDHRFSRLLALIPLYSVIAGLGFTWLRQQRLQIPKIIAMLIPLLMIINYTDFANFYWHEYPSIISNLLGDMSYYPNLAIFKIESDRFKLESVIHQGVASGGGESLKFFEVIYFGKLLRTIPDDTSPAMGELLLTVRKEVPCTQSVGNTTQNYFIFRRTKDCI